MNRPLRPFAEAPLARRMLEISPAAVAVLDTKKTIVFVNEKLTQLLGYPSEELVGHSADLILPEASICDFVTHPARPLSQTKNELQGEEQTILACCIDGVGVPVSLSWHRINSSREPLFLAHLARADTDLAGQDLLESERLAAIAQMVSGLAHESRNALQRAVACLDLLELDLKNNPEQMILSKRIRDSLADLLDNYDEVRRYAEPILISPQRLKLLHVCQGAFDELAVAYEEGAKDTESQSFQHHLEFSPGARQHDEVHVDRDKMKQAFRHLLDNAIDAADSIAHIQVECTPARLSNREAVKVTTRDHGRGFDNQALRHAFEPFYTTKQRGTGLGLAISRRIVEAHEGEIRAGNHADGGGLIEITIPVNLRQR